VLAVTVGACSGDEPDAADDEERSDDQVPTA
jgi:hypothetical protein